MSTGEWEIGDVAALLANPFYAIEIHDSLSRSHEYVMSERRWVASNARAVGEMGPLAWLRHLLPALQREHRLEDLSHPLAVADPYPAITVSRGLCEEHEPIVEESLWIAANAVGLEEDGEVWMRNLLSVLKGVYR